MTAPSAKEIWGDLGDLHILNGLTADHGLLNRGAPDFLNVVIGTCPQFVRKKFVEVAVFGVFTCAFAVSSPNEKRT